MQIFRVLRIIRSGKEVWRLLQRNRKEATIASILFLLVMLLTVASTLIIAVEATDPSANITSTGDALWWAFVTVSTVGYGDYYPVTTVGKVIATVVIICGVGIFGMISGLMTSIITTPAHQHHRPKSEDNHQLLEQILHQQQQLEKKLDKLEQSVSQIKNSQ
ncbi:hypothetical protein MACH09_24100 [Vibrio sp. MACH09]|nr:hypothetical protein MACH09_24100 [Vibrio sp. MACH09]